MENTPIVINMVTIKMQFTDFTQSPCCDKCDYSHNTIDGMSLEYDICPKCGGQMTDTVGRWMYTELHRWHDWFFRYGFPERIYHGFLRGTDTNINREGVVKPPPPHPDNNYTLEGSLNAYRAAHPPATKKP